MIWKTQCVTGLHDFEFVRWLRDRLVHVYGEYKGTDFVDRLGDIAEEIERHYHTPEVSATDWDTHGESHAG